MSQSSCVMLMNDLAVAEILTSEIIYQRFKVADEILYWERLTEFICLERDSSQERRDDARIYFT